MTSSASSSSIKKASSSKAGSVPSHRDVTQEKENYETLVLHRRPFSTLYYFSLMLKEYGVLSCRALGAHVLFRFVAIPLLLSYTVAMYVPGNHHDLLDRFNMTLEFVSWWLGLGILSSVGLGTGMHSGLLFLFPHIFFVVQGAERCGHVAFDTWHHIWFQSFSTECDAAPSLMMGARTTSVTFSAIFFKVFWPVFLWGTGTAMGEIPPYALSRAAAIAGASDPDFDAMMGTDTTDTDTSTTSSRPLNPLDRMKRWMIHLLQQYGFWGVFAMSAWPNMAFDLCGICCGHFLMPFWTFFTAVWAGKALVKANAQACFFITIFTDRYITKVTQGLDVYTPSGWQLSGQVQSFLLECRRRFHSSQSSTTSQENGTGNPVDNDNSSTIARLGSGLMVLFVLSFAVSCVNQFAKQQAKGMRKVKGN